MIIWKLIKNTTNRRDVHVTENKILNVSLKGELYLKSPKREKEERQRKRSKREGRKPSIKGKAKKHAKQVLYNRI